MSDSAWTVIIMACVTAVLIGWDVYVAFFNRIPNAQDTISGILQNVGVRRGVWGLPFALGVLSGHLFLPGFPVLEGWLGPVILLGAAIALSIGGAAYRRWGRSSSTSWLLMATILVAGMISGHLLWPQGAVP